MSRTASSIADLARLILNDPGKTEYDDVLLMRGINFAQTHLAKATRLTMQRVDLTPDDERSVTLPADLLDLDTAYLNTGSSEPPPLP